MIIGGIHHTATSSFQNSTKVPCQMVIIEEWYQCLIGIKDTQAQKVMTGIVITKINTTHIVPSYWSSSLIGFLLVISIIN